MSIFYRPLRSKDVDQLQDLLKERPYVFNGYTDKDFEEHILHQSEEWLSDPQYYLPALWEDETLLGIIVVKEFQNLPAFALGHWVSRKGAIWSKPDFFSAWHVGQQELFDEMEINRKLNKIFLSYKYDKDSDQNGKNIGMHNRFVPFGKRDKRDWRIAKYTWVTDCIIDAYQEPKYNYQKALLANRTWPFAVGVRMGVLLDN